MMAWQKYELVFRLQSPLHIGYRTVGNLMQTRGYVTGKVLWAALTARLTRDYDNGANGQCYARIGQQVQEHFRFTYLYPAISREPAKSVRSPGDLTIHYPWEEDFGYLFLYSHASTALDYSRQSAENATLHETEFVAPHTRTGLPVYLTGHLYVKTVLPTPLDKWQEALKKLQLGGERTYGWGRVRLICCDKLGEPSTEEPHAETHNGHITAHLKAENVTCISGPVEPLIGWERNNDKNGKSNWRLSEQAIICYAPGTLVTGKHDFIIDRDGFWRKD